MCLLAVGEKPFASRVLVRVSTENDGEARGVPCQARDRANVVASDAVLDLIHWILIEIPHLTTGKCIPLSMALKRSDGGVKGELTGREKKKLKVSAARAIAVQPSASTSNAASSKALPASSMKSPPQL